MCVEFRCSSRGGGDEGGVGFSRRFDELDEDDDDDELFECAVSEW